MIKSFAQIGEKNTRIIVLWITFICIKHQAVAPLHGSRITLPAHSVCEYGIKTIVTVQRALCRIKVIGIAEQVISRCIIVIGYLRPGLKISIVSLARQFLRTAVTFTSAGCFRKNRKHNGYRNYRKYKSTHIFQPVYPVS